MGQCRLKARPGFLVLQVVVGLVQFIIGMAIFAGYRKAGIWGEF